MKFYVTQTFIPAKYSSFSVRTRNSMEHIRQMWSSAVRVTVSSSHRVSSRWNQAFLFLPNIATGALPYNTDLLLHPSQRARSTSLGFLLTTSSAISSLGLGLTLGGRWSTGRQFFISSTKRICFYTNASTLAVRPSVSLSSPTRRICNIQLSRLQPTRHYFQISKSFDFWNSSLLKLENFLGSIAK